MTKPLYALGAFGAPLLVQTLTLWLFPFHVALGPARLTPEQVGLSLAVGRLANSAADLLVARWSDTLTTPWGRRRPFLLAAFFALFAAVVNPYLALLADLELPAPGRVAAAAWQAGGNLLGTAAAYVLSGPVHSRFGFPAMAAAFALVSVACLWSAAWSVRHEPAPSGRASLSEVLGLLARSLPLRAYLVGLSLAWVGLSMVSLVLVFLVTVLVRLPTPAVPGILSLALLSTAACLPLVTRWGQRAGPQRALEACLWVAAAFLPVISLVGYLPVSPRLAGYALVGLSGLPLAALYSLPNAILAQLAARHGFQALHFGVQGLVLNLANATAAAAAGLLLRWGYTPGHDLGLRLVPVCAAVLVSAGLAAFRRLRHS